MEYQRRKEEFTTLATANSEGKDVADTCRDLQEQWQLHQQNMDDLLRRTEVWQTVSSLHSIIGDLERSADDTLEPLLPTDRDKSKGNDSQPEVENGALQQQLREINLERERWQEESSKLRTAESEIKKLEEMCRDLLERVDQQNDEIRRNRVDLEKASNWHALAQQQIMEHKEAIRQLSKIQVAECIICMNEFGEAPDQQRAYWKDCNHANICYKCTKTLWTSNSRNCPSCKTPASRMPTRLPPKIYL